VVNQEGLVAVLHQDPETAGKALELIKAEFDVRSRWSTTDTIFDHILNSAPAARETTRGDLAAGEKAAASVFEGKYTTHTARTRRWKPTPQ